MNEKQIRLVRFILVGIILISSLVLIVGIATNNFASIFQQEEGDVVLFYHWWISSGEQAALNAMINVFLEKYPETAVLPVSIISRSSAGGGNVLFSIVRPLVLSGDAPDAFVMHAGYEAKTYVDANLLEPVNDIWETAELEKVTPKVVQVMCKFNGDFYSVPVGIHRTNVVWYNKKILDDAKINPSDITTWDSFFSACDKIKSSGIDYPIQLAATWTAQHAFDQIIASEGIDFYEDWVNGKITADDSRLINALETFKKYLSYTNPDHADVEWNTAIDRIVHGEGAFNIMGDWANGEFTSEGMIYEEDYGTFVVPGTRDMYGLVIDTFQRPKSVKHPENSARWLGIVASNEGQDAFNPLKGSISARIDTDVAEYGAYQKTAIFDFVTVKYMFPAISNGAPKEFEVREQQIIAEFAEDLNVEKAAKAFADYHSENSEKYTIEWELN
ncbi:MAG: ABC transporter substrate-binding protein [Candidatus Pacearchaeota archaeon]|nr:ABC transporter substrate-binding protein [Candidatus Pacearchaeota archaeon]